MKRTGRSLDGSKIVIDNEDAEAYGFQDADRASMWVTITRHNGDTLEGSVAYITDCGIASTSTADDDAVTDEELAQIDTMLD